MRTFLIQCVGFNDSRYEGTNMGTNCKGSLPNVENDKLETELTKNVCTRLACKCVITSLVLFVTSGLVNTRHAWLRYQPHNWRKTFSGFRILFDFRCYLGFRGLQGSSGHLRWIKSRVNSHLKITFCVASFSLFACVFLCTCHGLGMRCGLGSM